VCVCVGSRANELTHTCIPCSETPAHLAWLVGFPSSCPQVKRMCASDDALLTGTPR
jgi:hypothetical protein